MESDQLKPVPRILKNLLCRLVFIDEKFLKKFIFFVVFLNRLNITCENEGCTAIVKLDALANHLTECDFNPKKLVECENGCGMMISKDNVTVKINFFI
jgi:hypothetical protein